MLKNISNRPALQSRPQFVSLKGSLTVRRERTAALTSGLRRSLNVPGTLAVSNGKSAGKNGLITTVSAAIMTMIMTPAITLVTVINPAALPDRPESIPGVLETALR
jgi:hypothetical protein